MCLSLCKSELIKALFRCSSSQYSLFNPFVILHYICFVAAAVAWQAIGPFCVYLYLECKHHIWFRLLPGWGRVGIPQDVRQNGVPGPAARHRLPPHQDRSVLHGQRPHHQEHREGQEVRAPRVIPGPELRQSSTVIWLQCPRIGKFGWETTPYGYCFSTLSL